MFMAAAYLMPCDMMDTALPAVPEPCHLCLTLCNTLPPGFNVCGGSRSALHWTSLPLPDTCPVGFIFVWLAKTDIQAAFQQMEHWVSHHLSVVCMANDHPPDCPAQIDYERHDTAEVGNIVTKLGQALQA